MPPTLASTLMSKLVKRTPFSSDNLKQAWIDPSVLTIVMIIGGDIVQVALAQLTGSFYTPVPFSFGWVAYSFTSLILSVGENKLMPNSDCSCMLINTKSHHGRAVGSWIIGRIMRDYEYWQPRRVKEEVERILDEGTERDRTKARRKAQEKGIEYVEPARRRQAGLCVSFYKSPGARAGVPMRDWVYWTGVIVTIVQFGISIIPWILDGDWTIFMYTASGTLLAILAGAIPQWKHEKWECRRSKKRVALTRGNGAQHVIIIDGVDDNSLDLEDLASGIGSPRKETRYYCAILSFIWIAYLVTVSGNLDNPWYLLAVGGIGMIQNVFVAGVPRRTEAFGIYLELTDIIAKPLVMDTLKEVENRFPGVGASLVSTFFPGKLRPDDVVWWDEAEKRLTQNKR